jgi:hypothetical protein
MQAIFFPGVLDRGDWFRERDLQIKAPRVRESFANPGAGEYRDLGRAMTAALCRKLAGESWTDVKEMENRKPWRHKKVPMDAIRSSRIWSRKVEEELCYGASQACFEGEASK